MVGRIENYCVERRLCCTVVVGRQSGYVLFNCFDGGIPGRTFVVVDGR